MPELPDVEVFRRYIDATALQKMIENIEVEAAGILRDISASQFIKALRDRTLISTRRHGKYLFATLDDGKHLLLHFGMTGSVKYYKKQEKRPRHTRISLFFSNGYVLAFDCQRKLGYAAIVEDVERFIEAKKLGPDALADDLNKKEFVTRLQERRGMLKTTLMNQQVLAGIGNVYSDELLFQLGLHPKATVQDLKEKKLARLHDTMRRILHQAVEAGAEPENMDHSLLLHHRNGDGKCPSCQGEIEKIQAGGRKAMYCPSCQTT